jgi:hypothetical protein
MSVQDACRIPFNPPDGLLRDWVNNTWTQYSDQAKVLHVVEYLDRYTQQNSCWNGSKRLMSLKWSKLCTSDGTISAGNFFGATCAGRWTSPGSILKPRRWTAKELGNARESNKQVLPNCHLRQRFCLCLIAEHPLVVHVPLSSSPNGTWA